MRRQRLLPLLVILLAGCQGAGQVARPVPATRAAELSGCPVPASAGVPQDLPLADREVLNLGSGRLGHRVVFQRTTARRVVLSVGVEALDAFEDLDMRAVDRVVGGHRVTLSTTLLQPRLTVVELVGRPFALTKDCLPVFVITESLTAVELSRLLTGLSFSTPTEG